MTKILLKGRKIASYPSIQSRIWCKNRDVQYQTTSIFFQDWGSIDPEKFTINSNGGHKFSLKDNIERGNYNMLLDDCILWRPETNQESHDMFRGALPGGFAWELVELTSGKVFIMQ